MAQGIPTISDPESLIAIAIDQTIPSDIRRAAGNRLQEVNFDSVWNAIKSADHETIAKVSRSRAFFDPRYSELARSITARLASQFQRIKELEKTNAKLRARMQKRAA